MSTHEKLCCDSCGSEISLDAGRCSCGTRFDTVRRVSEAVLETLGHKDSVALPKNLTDDPTEAGYRSSKLGRRKGQESDYRMSASELRGDRDEDRRELHLREYEDRYTLHWDAYPARNPLHAVKDAPDYGAACVAAVGVVAAAVGSGLVRHRGRDEEEPESDSTSISMENVIVGGEAPKSEKEEDWEEPTRRISEMLPSVGVAASLSKRLGQVSFRSDGMQDDGEGQDVGAD